MHINIFNIFGLMVPAFLLNCSPTTSTNNSNIIQSIPIGIEYNRNGFGGIIAYDLDNDNEYELILSQEDHIGVYSVRGKKLWLREYDLHLSNGKGWLPGYHAAGVQVANVDGVGKAILTLSSRNTLLFIDSSNGDILKDIAIPPIFDAVNQWEHLVVCSFRGQGESDLFMQATKAGYRDDFRIGCYIVAFSISDLFYNNNPTPLWKRDDFIGPAHGGARIADLDCDGKDEVIGATTIDSSGDLIIRVPVGESPHDHVDAIHIDDVQPMRDGLEVLLLQESHGSKKNEGNNIFLFNKKGLIFKTHHKRLEAQNAAVGDFDLSRPGKEIWLRSRFKYDQKPFVIDANGKLITTYNINTKSPIFWSDQGVEVITPIFWHDPSRQLIAAKERHKVGNVAIIDPITGDFIVKIPEKAIRLYVADILGDWYEELVVINDSSINIYASQSIGKESSRTILWEKNSYRRSKHFWTYYYP